MTVSYVDGVNEIFAHGKAVFETAAVEVLGSVPLLTVQGEESPNLPGNAFWGRIEVTTVAGFTPIVGQLDNSGTSRYRSAGILLVEIFSARVVTGDYWKARRIAARMRELTVKAVTPGRVFFQNVRVDDTPKTNTQWLSVALLAEWQFDEVI